MMFLDRVPSLSPPSPYIPFDNTTADPPLKKIWINSVFVLYLQGLVFSTDSGKTWAIASLCNKDSKLSSKPLKSGDPSES